MDLSGTTITWRNLTLYGKASLGRFGITALEGWEELPAPRQDSSVRPQAHGRFSAPVFGDERHVVITGRCASPEQRDSLLQELQANFNFYPDGELPLTITNLGRTLTAYARLLRFKPTIDNWGAGIFDWAAELVCSDPLRYGPVQTYVRPFAMLSGGLEFDLYTDGAADTGYLEYGVLAATNRFTLTNSGDEDVWPQFDIAGPIPVEGFEIVCVTTSKKLRYVGEVPPGSHLMIDAATGSVVLDGYADRSGLLTVRDWSNVPAGSTREFEFDALGAFSAATLTASISPGWW